MPFKRNKYLAKKIKEMVETGQSQYHQELLGKIPKGLLDMLRLQTVGPQKVRLFFKQLNITSVAELEAARDRVLALHRSWAEHGDQPNDTCRACARPWPCETVRAAADG